MSRLEKEAHGLYRTFTLPDGQQIRYTHEEVMAALSAAIHCRDHFLLDHIRWMEISPETPSMIRLVRTIVKSHTRE